VNKLINRILIELYDNYVESGNLVPVEDFAELTFKNEGVRKLFVGTFIILADKSSNAFKPRYEINRENLIDVVSLAKEKVGDTNLLAFYIDRVNTTKGITSYLNDIANDEKVSEYANLLLEYLDQFKPRMVEMVMDKYNSKN
jgi:hypothetical protein